MEAWRKREIEALWNPAIRFFRGELPQVRLCLIAVFVIAFVCGIVEAAFSGIGSLTEFFLDVLVTVLVFTLGLYGLLALYIGFLTWGTLRLFLARSKMAFEKRVGFDVFGGILVAVALIAIGRGVIYQIPEVGPEAIRSWDAVTTSD